MNIGVGLPTTIPGTDGGLISEWAMCADEGPFSSLGVLDRLVYDSYDPLVALASVAAVTRRMQLATTIIVSLLHSTALLAKTTASLHALSGGRLIVGLSVGARKDDYAAAGIDYQERGKRFAAQLAALQAAWEDENLCPQTAQYDPPPILVGGTSDHTYSRMARYADGYIHGGGPPRAFARAADKARAAWIDAGRPGKPRLWGQGYFAFGNAAIEAGTRYLRDYYAFTGPFVEHITAELLTSPQAVAQFIRGYAEAGCDELILFPTVADIAQLEQLAAIVATLQQDNAALIERGSV
jgi:alkanesulfonate monooxygenase SsuD/methylene tetrahydromethanopterin reductase-like flavin-dependent oxidoreductase (luciferase family)